MLPKLRVGGSVKKFEWQLVEPNKDGRINCLDCKETFSSMENARRHHRYVHMMKNT